jgi:peptidoglycan/LPS O-acetylase OafA/YrhL
MTRQLSRYKELDALRGIASIFVVLFHFTMGRKQAALGFTLGVTGVDLFFIISGFVIFMSINKVSTSLEFFINRFSRLYPTYWVCVTFTFLLQLYAPWPILKLSGASLWQYFGNMTMFQYYLRVPDLDGPYWTMIIEMLFYISIAFLFTFKKMKYILPIGLSVVIITALNHLWFDHYFPALHQIHKIFPLITHFPLFLAGIIFYKLINSKNEYKQQVFYYSCLLICFAAKLILFEDGGRSAVVIKFYPYLVALSCYFLVFILFVNHKLSYIVNGSTLFFGKISFALYLIHQYISTHLILPCLINYFHFGFWLAAIVTFAIVVLLAAAITYYIEIPLGKKMKSLLRAKFGLRKHTPTHFITLAGILNEKNNLS